MTHAPAALLLDDRGVLRLAGADAVSFLQGLVSNDVAQVAPNRAIHAALLTPQGRYLHDFMIARHDDALLLDCDRARIDDLKRRLGLYKLRARVTIADASDQLAVAVLWPDSAAARLGLPAEPGAARAFAGGIAFVDPRLAALGARAILPLADAATKLAAAGSDQGWLGDYEHLRIASGVPAGGRDLVVDKSILLENGFDELHGVDWQKGCYVGQEVTARSKYRGLIKKRLLPVAVSGTLPPPGTAIRLGEAEAGEMRSGVESGGTGVGLCAAASRVRDRGRTLGHTARRRRLRLTVMRPGWMSDWEEK